MTLLAIGLMTGSSMDGIDAVLMETDGERVAQRLHSASLPFSAQFHKLLRSAEFAVQQERGNVEQARRDFSPYLETYLSNNMDSSVKDDISSLKKILNLQGAESITLESIIHKLTLFHKELIFTLLSEAGVQAAKVDVIGFHGQNLYHNPDCKITFQAGDGQLLSDATNIFVVNDFRSNDVQKGGQGAPFAPLYHQVLALKGNLTPVAILNCGGIANISIVAGNRIGDVTGFDTGPGNVLIDRYIRQKTGYREFMDAGGKYGRQGKVVPEVLTLLQEKAILCSEGNKLENFLYKRPPKSLDTLNCFLIPELQTLSLENACATLEAFTARCIVDSLDFVDGSIPCTWILAGGGWQNPVISDFLHKFLKEKLGNDIKIMNAEEAGWRSQSLEAEIFAWLAVRTLRKMPISYPKITGVPEPVYGGRGYCPVNGSFSPKVQNLIKSNPQIMTGYL
jgi:anhydro-N-acetylmuramic acid kinase